MASEIPTSLLVVVLGPTGSGKTALSLKLARDFAGEIVNCDSVAMYRELDLGTAKPSAEERRQATHHLFDVIAPTDYMSAGEYARRAREVLDEIKKRVPAKRLGQTADIASGVLFLASEGAGYITGQVLTIDGGLCA